MNSKGGILVCNGVALAGGIVVALLSGLGALSPISRDGVVWYCIPLALLGLAEWLAYRERYGVAEFLMVVGGVGTLPIGLLAIIGSRAAHHMRLQARVQRDLAVPCACVQCGYDLRGAPVPQCPECGCIIGGWDGPRCPGHG